MSDSGVNVELTDLTGENPESGTKRNRTKSPKAAAPDKADKKEKKEKHKSEEHKKKGILFKLLIIGIPIILVAAFVAEEIVFNWVGTRNYVRDFFISAAAWLDPESSGIIDNLSKREEEFIKFKTETEVEIAKLQRSSDERETGLSERESTLDEREAAIADREAQMDRQKESLTAWEKEISEKEFSLTPAFRRDLSDQEIEDMQSLARTYAAMEADTAASIMAALYNEIDAASILYYMSERNAAAILSVMDVDFAAKVTEILLL